MPIIAPELCLKQKIDAVIEDISNDQGKTTSSFVSDFRESLITNVKRHVGRQDESTLNKILNCFNTAISILESKAIQSDEEFVDVSKELADTTYLTEEYAEVLLSSICLLASDLKKKASDICDQNGIKVPDDNSKRLIDFKKDKIMFSQHDAGELRYMRTLMDQSLEKLQSLNSVRSMPYLRNIEITDDAVLKIQTAQGQYKQKIKKILSDFSLELQENMSENGWSDTVPTEADFNKEKETKKRDAEEAVNAVARIDVSGIDIFEPSTTRVADEVKHYESLVLIARRKIQENANIGIIHLKRMAEVYTPSPKLKQIAIDRGVEYPQGSGRFDSLTDRVKSVSHELKQLQQEIGEDISDFNLTNALRDWTEEHRSFDAIAANLLFSDNSNEQAQRLLTAERRFQDLMNDQISNTISREDLQQRSTDNTATSQPHRFFSATTSGDRVAGIESLNPDDSNASTSHAHSDASRSLIPRDVDRSSIPLPTKEELKKQFARIFGPKVTRDPNSDEQQPTKEEIEEAVRRFYGQPFQQ